MSVVQRAFANSQEGTSSDNLIILPLDVTDDASVRHAIHAAGPIEVLVNNAGIGWLNALEGTPIDVAQAVFETNTIGTMRMVRAVLPQFRERGAGLIINVTSSVTMKPLPLLSVYTASKAAVNAFTESLALELAPLGIAVKIVLPSAAPDTSFGNNAMALLTANGGFPNAYSDFANSVSPPCEHRICSRHCPRMSWTPSGKQLPIRPRRCVSLPVPTPLP